MLCFALAVALLLHGCEENEGQDPQGCGKETTKQACVKWPVLRIRVNTGADGTVLLIGSTVYTEHSGRFVRLSFDRRVCLFVGRHLGF